MKRFIEHLPHPDRWPFWLATTVVIKLITLGIMLANGSAGNGSAGALGMIWNDSGGYFDPIESLLAEGQYTPDVRMPGYGAPYLLARTISNPPGTYDVLVILQLLLAAVNMYVLARLAFRLTGWRPAFLLMLVIYALSISVHWYDVVMLAESFATSAMIFFLDRLLVWSRTGKRTALIVAGLWLTWAIFLKPVLAPVPVIVLLGIWMARIERPSFIRNALVFLLPLILTDGAWIIRNMLKYDGIYPLTRTLYVSEDHPEPKLYASEFVIAWGGDMVWWVNPKAEVRFFNVGNDQVPGNTNADEITLPDRIMTSAYNLDSLKALSSRIFALKDPAFPEELREQEIPRINATLDHYRTVFIAEHPFQYHVLSRLRAFSIFVKQTGNPVAYAQTFVQMPLPLKALKLFQISLHWATLLLGLAGAWWWWRSTSEKAFTAVATLIIPFGLLVFPFGLRFSEHRYLVPFIPFLLLSAIVGSWLKFAKRS